MTEPILRCLLLALMFTSVAEGIAQKTVRGIVTGRDKKPVQNAQVIALPEQTRYYTPEELTPLSSARSNSEGKFSLAVPTTGPVALVAWSPKHRMTKFPLNLNAVEQRTIGLALENGYTLRGRVNDGATGKPVVGAQVGPLVAGLDTETQRSLRVIPQWATTDDTGEFQLEGLATDIQHSLLVQNAGYALANVELSQRQSEVIVPLDKGGFSISGEVFARNERPSAFANVLVRINGNGFDLITRTDSQGRFNVSGLPGGNFSVEPLLPGSNRAAKVQVIELPRDDKSSVSLELSGGYMIRGTTVDIETSTPASQVSVGIADHRTSSSTDGTFALGPFFAGMQLQFEVPEESGWQLGSAQTGSEYDSVEGFSDLNGVILRVHRQRLLNLTLEGFESTTQPVTVTVLDEKGRANRETATSSSVAIPVYRSGTYYVYATSGDFASQGLFVPVGLERSVPVSLRLQAGADVSGKLVVTNTTETTRAQTLKLSLVPVASGVTGPPLFTATNPREDGSFRFQSMPVGEFLLSVANKSGTHQTTHPLTLLPGTNNLGEISWAAGHKLAGTVLDPKSNPVPFSRISLLLPNGTTVRLEAGEDGSFAAEDLHASQISTLMVEAGSFAVFREHNVALPDTDKKVVIQPVGKLTVKVEAPPETQWKLNVMRIGRWVAGAYADQMIGPPIHTQDALGGEAIEIGLGESGTFRVVATAVNNDELRVSDEFAWAGHANEGKMILLPPVSQGRIEGTVTDLTGEAEVTVINTIVPEKQTGGKAEQTALVKNGRFSFSDLAPGNYMVLCQGESYAAFSLNVDLLPGEVENVALQMQQTGEVTGHVELGGQPLDGVNMELLSQTDPSFTRQTEVTDGEGQFSFDGLLPDSYVVTARYNDDQGELNAKQNLILSPSKPTAKVTLDLTPPETVTLTVGAGVNLPPQSEVQLMSTESRQLVPARWENGALKADAKPGAYEVWLGDSVIGKVAVGADGSGTIVTP